MAAAASLQAVDFGQGVSNAWSSIALFIPKLLMFIIILVVGYFLAKAVEKVLDRVLVKVGFDRMVERGGIKRALSRSEYDAAGILGKIVFYAIMLFVLSTAFGVFGPNPVDGYLHAVIAYLPQLFAAVVIIVVAAAIAAGVRNVVTDLLGGLSYGPTLAGAASVAILFIGVIAALDQLQIATAVVNAVLYAVLAAAVGIAVVAVGGGGIAPMRRRWDNVLASYDSEKDNVRAELEAGRARRQAARGQVYDQNAYPEGAAGYGQDTGGYQQDAAAYGSPDPLADPPTRPLRRP